MKENGIAIIGAGNLGISIAEGLVKKGLREPQQITLVRRNIDVLQKQADKGFPISASVEESIEESKVIFLCVQPNHIEIVLEDLDRHISQNRILVSVVTGVSIAKIKSHLKSEISIVRAMPNTAIAIGESMTCLTTEDQDSDVLTEIVTLFDALGQTLVINEELMQAATVLGASGVAFFMRYLRAATQGGVQMGFESADAQMIAMQTAKGAAMLVLEGQSHPEVEIDKVTTPQGCTIEGLNEMEHKGFSSALIQGIMTSYSRITKMKGE